MGITKVRLEVTIHLGTLLGLYTPGIPYRYLSTHYHTPQGWDIVMYTLGMAYLYEYPYSTSQGWQAYPM